MASSTFNKYKNLVRLDRYITVRGQYEGFHAYKDAPDEVAFLRNAHRHIFKWQAEIEVGHDNRELEFFMVKWNLEQKVLPFMQMTELGSCEMQAEKILQGLVNSYGHERYYRVAVSEDGENDGVVEWDPSDLLDRTARNGQDYDWRTAGGTADLSAHRSLRRGTFSSRRSTSI